MGHGRSASSSATAATPIKSLKYQEYTTDLPEALELVVSSSCDAQLLCKCSTASSYFQALVTSSIQQRLPELLTHCLLGQGLQGQQASHRSPAVQRVRWLCSTAGRSAMGQRAVAQALLSPQVVVTRVSTQQPADEDEPVITGYSRGWAWEPVRKILAATGLLLSDDLVAAAARQHLPSIKLLVRDLLTLPINYSMAKMRTGLSAAYIQVMWNEEIDMSKALESVGPNTMQDLMFIAVNEHSTAAWRLLQRQDGRHTHVLSGGTAGGSGSSSARRQVNARRARRPAHASTGAAAANSLSSGQEQEQQRAQLMEQLLLTSLMADDARSLGDVRNNPIDFKHQMLADLISLEPAQALDTSTVLKLMLVAAMRGNGSATFNTDFGSCGRRALTQLSNLAGAQGITADEVFSIIRTALHNSSCSTDPEGLLELPGARSMTSSQLCQLILLSVRRKAAHVTRALSKLAMQCEVECEDVLQLLKTALPELGSDRFLRLLETLTVSAMAPCDYLTAEDVMQLLPQIMMHRGCYDERDILSRALGMLQLAVKEFVTAERYVAFLTAMLTASYYEETDEVIKPLLGLHNHQDLRRQDVLQLLQFCVTKGHAVQSLAALPAAAEVNVAEAWDFMQLCFQDLPPTRYDDDTSSTSSDEPKPRIYMLEVLLALPAARSLTPDQVLQLLQQILRLQPGSSISSLLLFSLLKLPAAQHISPAGAEAVVLAALGKAPSAAWMLDALCCHLPACAAAFEALDPQQLQQQLQAALAGNKNCGVSVCKLLQHPKLQQHLGGVLPMVLLAAFHSRPQQPVGVSPWCQSRPGSGYQGIQLAMTDKELRQLLHLPAAAGLSTPVIGELIALSAERMGGRLLQDLVSLPAAAQLEDEVIWGLLQQAAGHASTVTADQGLAAGTTASAAGTATAATAGTAAQQQREKSASWSKVVQECLGSDSGPAVLFPLLQLPWAQLLPASTIRVLLQEAVERQARPTFDRLMQLPQAPRGAVDVQLFADALQASARDGMQVPFLRSCIAGSSEEEEGVMEEKEWGGNEDGKGYHAW